MKTMMLSEGCWLSGAQNVSGEKERERGSDLKMRVRLTVANSGGGSRSDRRSPVWEVLLKFTCNQEHLSVSGSLTA